MVTVRRAGRVNGERGERRVGERRNEGDHRGAAGERRHRTGEVRRLPGHGVVVDARRGGALGGRHQQPGAAAARRRSGRSARRRPSTRSGTAATGTSTRSSSRCCCSASARCSRCTRASTSSRAEEPLTSPLVAVIILVVAIGLEGYSFRTAIAESRPLKGRLSWWGFIRQSKSPELPVVLLEDFGALIGLVLALLGVGLTVLTGEPRVRRARHDRHRRAARRHRRHPHRRDEEPADRRGGERAGARGASSGRSRRAAWSSG